MNNTSPNSTSSSCEEVVQVDPIPRLQFGDVRFTGSGLLQYRDSEAPQGLYNERLGRCTDKKCKWNPNLHQLKAARNGGRSLRINSVKGGCPPSCKVISHEYNRLCRNCFDTMHRVGTKRD
eukprot:scaffold828_cov58-Cyclotella_meneghiniana.AAC.2